MLSSGSASHSKEGQLKFSMFYFYVRYEIAFWEENKNNGSYTALVSQKGKMLVCWCVITRQLRTDH